MLKLGLLTSFATLLCALAACGGAKTKDVGGPDHKKPAMARPATLEEQLRLGAQLYEEECAGCHGSDGSGKKSAPAIMGPDALPEIPHAGALRRTVPFKTAKDVLQWTAESMPANEPGSLDPTQYEAIIAHQLTVLGKNLGDTVLTPETAAAIYLR